MFEQLRAAGIGVQVNYLPVYWHPVFEDLGYRRGMRPKAEAYYAEELSLPLFPDLTDAEQDRVVESPARHPGLTGLTAASSLSQHQAAVVAPVHQEAPPATVTIGRAWVRTRAGSPGPGR